MLIRIMFAVIIFELLSVANSGYTEEALSNTEREEVREIAEDKAKHIRREETLRQIERENAHTISEQFLRGIGNSVLDRVVESARTAAEINASKDASNASIRIGRQISSSGDGGLGEFSAWSLTASAPIDKKNDLTELATLDGLANAFKLSFKFSNFIVTGKRNPFSANPNPEEWPPRLKELCTLASIDLDKGNTCEAGALYRGLKKNNLLQLYPEFKSLFWSPNSWKLIYGIEGTTGYENFEFINPETLISDDKDETPWAAGVFFGVIPPGLNALFTVGVEYQEAYQAARTQTICPATTGVDSVICTTGAIGGPNQQDKELVYFEGRGELLKVGFSLRITHDFESDDTGVDLPIYLFRDKKNNLNGGFRVGWTDNNDDFNFGVFVGSSFTLFQ